MAKLMFELTRNELDAYVTDRLLDFYEGLIERGQIPRPVREPRKENPAPIRDCTADQGCQLDRAQSEGALQHSIL